MTVPSQDPRTSGKLPSQRGPFLVLVVLIALLVGVLGVFGYLGLRMLDDVEWTSGTGSSSSKSDEADEADAKGSIRFQLVTAESPATPGKPCPKNGEWAKHEGQCLRFGGGFPAIATAEAIRQNGQPVVAIRLDPPADKTLAEFTEAANGQRVALIASDEVITAPTITGQITGGEVQIAGDFTEADTERLADLVNAG